MIVNIPDFGNLNTEEMSFNYQWHGYSKSLDEFINYNFTKMTKDERTCLICNSENGLAFVELLCEYVLPIPELGFLEEFLISGMDFWFCKVWECGESTIEESNMETIIDILLKHKLVNKIEIEKTTSDSDYIIYYAYATDIELNLSDEIKKEIYIEIMNIASTYYNDLDLDNSDDDERKEQYKYLISLCEEKKKEL